jgi:hypothetical protein
MSEQPMKKPVLPLLGADNDGQMDMQIVPAVHHYVGKIKFGKEVVDQLNEEIDRNSLAKGENKDNALVGQLRQDKNSAQLGFDLESEVGSQFRIILNSAATSYLNNGYKKKSYADCFVAWTNHAYAGDYNPFHEHATPTMGGLSGFMWLGLPKIMEERRLNKGKHQMDFGDADGQYDGWTHMVWGLGSKVDLYALKMGCEEYVQPEVGVLYIFPKWLHHQTLPFFGEGERRSIAMNWAVMESEEELKKIMSPAEYEDFKSKIPEDVDKSLPYQTSIGGALLSVKLDD